MRNLALMWVLAGCLLGCGGRNAKDKADMAAVIPDTVAAAPDTVAVAPDTDTTFTDKRDGKVYKIVKIGSQIWFAENLNYVTEGSKCYGEGGKIFIKTLIERDDNNKIKGIKDITKTLSDAEVQANCSKYGRLYTWDAAMKACPTGWHAPTFAEWDTLKEFVEDEYTADEGYTAGKKLKSTSGWDDWKGKSGNGMDEYGFSALPGGSTHGRDADGSIFPDIAGKRGNWWSATEIEYCIDDQGNCGWDYAKSRGMGYYGGSLTLSYTYKDEFMSVRCVLDDEKETRK